MRIISKFARDLAQGDVVVRIDGQDLPPTLFYENGKAHIHFSSVYSVVESMEQIPVFDPVEQDQEPPDTETRTYSRSERLRWQMERANAKPNAGRDFPTVQITLHGHQNDTKLDQGAVMYELRFLSVVDVLEGDPLQILPSEKAEVVTGEVVQLPTGNNS